MQSKTGEHESIYRVAKKDGKFWPQYKSYFCWRFFRRPVVGGSIPLNEATLKEAQEIIKKEITRRRIKAQHKADGFQIVWTDKESLD